MSVDLSFCSLVVSSLFLVNTFGNPTGLFSFLSVLPVLLLATLDSNHTNTKYTQNIKIKCKFKKTPKPKHKKEM